MRIVHNCDLTPYNSYRVESRCVKACFPESEVDVLAFFREHPLEKSVILGSGHNIILAKPYYDKPFLVFKGCFDAIRIQSRQMYAEAGAFSKNMAEVALENSLSGLEVFYDIPSSLGGAVVMNAGAGGIEIASLIESVRYLDTETMVIVEAKGDDLEFGYRQSVFQKDSGKIVLSAQLNLLLGQPENIRQTMEDLQRKRHAKQPWDKPNAGSVFKRPQDRYVGLMIEELGLKGKTIGGAMISEKHAGFIINKNSATGRDIINLLDYAKRSVSKKYNVQLYTEQVIIQ